MIEYSIADGRNKFTQLVHLAETDKAIGLTRRGKPVAVLLSIDEYERLSAGKKYNSFYEAIMAWREEYIDDQWEAIPDEVFDNIRAESSGREENPWE